MRSPLWLLGVVALLGAGLLFAETAQVTKRTVWIVPYDHEGTISVHAGDIVEVWTQPLALVPENLESRFRASKVGAGVELIGETLPHKEGTMERLFFFKAFDPGRATLQIELVGMDGAVRDVRTYEVEVVAPECQD